MTEGVERTFSYLAHKKKVRVLEALKHFRISPPAQPGAQPKDLAATRRALTWERVEGEKTVKARLAAEGYLGPDLRMGNVDIAGCVGSRTCHLQVMSMRALMTWPL